MCLDGPAGDLEAARDVGVAQSLMEQLEDVANSIKELATNGEFESPIEISYAHTARDGSQGPRTKIETITLTDAEEASDAARVIEKKMHSWDKLREQMLVDLKQKQGQLEEMKRGLSDFVDSSKRLLPEVFAVLH